MSSPKNEKSDLMTSPVETGKKHPRKRSKRHQPRETKSSNEDQHRFVDNVATTTNSNSISVMSGGTPENGGEHHNTEKYQLKRGRAQQHHRKRPRELQQSQHDPANDTTTKFRKGIKNCKIQKESSTSPTRAQQQRKVIPMLLTGHVVSVSTLQGAITSPDIERVSYQTKQQQDRCTLSSYQEVCERCRDLGATVSELVSKRVMALVCTKEAANQATQRVRKAIKRHIPIVSVEWIVSCQQHGQVVSMEPYRLDSEAKVAINRRQDGRPKANSGISEINGNQNELFGTPITKVIDLGCCCVCHEQGTTVNCPWCKNCQIH